jgi:hypothetical protein
MLSPSFCNYGDLLKLTSSVKEASGNSQQSSTITTTKRSCAPCASRDLRLKACTLHDLGWGCQAIPKELNLTIRQVLTAITYSHPTPENHKERPSILSSHHIQILIEWVTSCKANRRMPWDLIPEAVASRLEHTLYGMSFDCMDLTAA